MPEQVRNKEALCYIIFIAVVPRILCQENNVCTTLEDYENPQNNRNCWYNFAADFSCPEIIRRSGYEVEEHEATTKDGYILTLFRIPHVGGQPVFLLHGFTGTATNAVSSGNRSLAFILAEKGFDVWLGNFRGSEYSEKHVNLTLRDLKYWDYSTDEIGMYDVPALIDLINGKTGRGDLIFIGYSLGTSVGLIYSSVYPEVAKRMVKLFIFIGPAYTLSNIIAPFRFVEPVGRLAMKYIRSFQAEHLLSEAHTLRSITKTICLGSPQLMKFFVYIMNLFGGLNNQTPPERIPIILNQWPGGAGLKAYFQLAQQLDKFSMYDYGAKNYQIYGKPKPPQYDISKILVPCYVVYSPGDWITTKQDALILYKTLPPKARFGRYEVKAKNFNHFDYMFGRYAKELVYDHLVTIIDKINNLD